MYVVAVSNFTVNIGIGVQGAAIVVALVRLGWVFFLKNPVHLAQPQGWLMMSTADEKPVIKNAG